MGLMDKLFGKNDEDEDDYEDEEPLEKAVRKEEPAEIKEMPGLKDNEPIFGGGSDLPNNVLDFTSHASAKAQETSAAAGGAHMKVVVVTPTTYDDAQQIADYLLDKRPVVVNFENTDTSVAGRVYDFVCGVIYALSGSKMQIGKNVFLFAPKNVNVTKTVDSMKRDGGLDMSWNR